MIHKILTERQWPKPPPGMDATIVVVLNDDDELAKGLKWLEPTTSLVGSIYDATTVAIIAGFVLRNTSQQVIRDIVSILLIFTPVTKTPPKKSRNDDKWMMMMTKTMKLLMTMKSKNKNATKTRMR